MAVLSPYVAVQAGVVRMPDQKHIHGPRNLNKQDGLWRKQEDNQ